MNHATLTAAALLSNADLLARLQHLASGARENTVEMVAHLSELEARRSYLAEGYGSLFDYCHLALRLSEHAAYNRVVAARVVRQFPSILAGLADGSLNLTTVRLVASHLTVENHRHVLGRAAGLSKREAEALVASLAPQPDVASSVRRIPPTQARRTLAPINTTTERALEEAAGEEPSVPASPLAVVGVPAVARTPAAPPAATRPIVAPLSPGRYRVQFTIDTEIHEDLRLLKDLLRREIPDGDPGIIFARALKLLLAHVAKEKVAATATPGRPRLTAPGSRHIPAAVKRAVWLRDRGQCAFVAKLGRRCAERAFLELHHIHPFAHCGEATVANISLRCRRHNVYESELVFGTLEPPLVSARPAGRTNAAATDVVGK